GALDIKGRDGWRDWVGSYDYERDVVTNREENIDGSVANIRSYLPAPHSYIDPMSGADTRTSKHDEIQFE
ncbi:MAG: hypothetical protein LC130_26360, partial [Bryobacterales bacterium]|nr:hypothetical protein [Bryobacterales bacterium]